MLNAALFTACDTAVEVLALLELSPLYTAVIECGEPATDKVLMLSVATPEAFKFTLPNSIAPSLKSTEPVGVPLPPVTVAVKVTELPYTDGLADEVTMVDDGEPVVTFKVPAVPVKNVLSV